jgi:hypothetical protein
LAKGALPSENRVVSRAILLWPWVLLLCIGCASWQETTLYFGLARPGGAVSADEWQRFVDEEATPRFPDGFTVVEAAGHWRSAQGAHTHEPSRVLVLLHPATRQFDRAIDELRRAYIARFHQESVLRADSSSRVRFR